MSKRFYKMAGVICALVLAVVANFMSMGKWFMVLVWTPANMHSAHRLYEYCGFERIGEMIKNEINFIVYEKTCRIAGSDI